MYSRNSSTGKIFLTDGMISVNPNTQGYSDYVLWLSNGGTPIDSDYLDNDDIDTIKKPLYKERINNYFSMMYTRALSSSMNKSSNDINYLLGLREVYQDKYDVSKGIVTSGVKYDNTLELIQSEMADEFSEAVLDALLPTYGITPTGTHLNKMFQLIIFKFEYGYNSFSNFKKFIESFRTKSFTWLDASEFTKLDGGFAIVDDLPGSLNVSDSLLLYNQFNAL